MSEEEHKPEGQDRDQESIPKVPRGRFFTRLTMVDLFRIGLFAVLLVAVIGLRRPCADGVANFFEMFATAPPDAGPTLRYERLTDEQIRERFPSLEQDGGALRGAAGDAAP